METTSGGDENPELFDHSSVPESAHCHNDEYKAKRGHVLTELLETEKIYVSELLSIIKVSKVAQFLGANII